MALHRVEIESEQTPWGLVSKERFVSDRVNSTVLPQLTVGFWAHVIRAGVDASLVNRPIFTDARSLEEMHIVMLRHLGVRSRDIIGWAFHVRQPNHSIDRMELLYSPPDISAEIPALKHMVKSIDSRLISPAAEVIIKDVVTHRVQFVHQSIEFEPVSI